MRTETRLKKYQERLKNNAHPRQFNPYAFIFNSFYYLYTAMPWYFALYFIGGFALIVAIYIATHSLWAVPGVMIGLRIVNAFTANWVYLKHIHHFIERNQDVNYSKPVIFYPISVRRLMICCLASGGLYQIYWMYKNWKAVKTETFDNEIHPIWQSWFLGIFFIYPLLKIVRINLQRSKIEGKHFVALASGYTISLFIQVAITITLFCTDLNVFVLYTGWLLNIAIWLGGLTALAAIQKRINFHNRKKNPKLQMQTGYHFGEITVILIGFILNYGALVNAGIAIFRQPLQQNDENLGIALSSTYRMMEGYSGFCRKQGYEMTNFPAVYADYFHPEIEVINQRLEPYHLTMEQAWEFFRVKLDMVMDDSIMSEFMALKPAVIEQIIQQYKKENIENFDEDVARKFLEKEITFPVICSETDNNARTIIDNNDAYKKFFRDIINRIK